MNTNRLYLAYIYVTINVDWKGNNILRNGKFIKMAVVYHNEYDEYIDVKSGEKYKKGIKHVYDEGDMFINFEKGLIPLNEISELNINRKNMSKRKILKKLLNTSLYNKKEEDK